MKNTFGNNVTVTLFGESHGEAIGCIIDGISPGITVDEVFVASQLKKRKGIDCISTQRREADMVKIVSGVFEGKTTGTPVCILIENSDAKSKDYEKNRYTARPSHADFTAECKYHGFQDYRGGGHFSGRLTAPLVAAGAIAISALKEKGIAIGTHIAKSGDIKDRTFENFSDDIAFLEKAEIPFLSEEKKNEAVEAIKKIAEEGDSIGGILETAVTGMPSGVGEPWFDTVESVLSHALFSIPAIKGVEFGAGFSFADMKGSAANDQIRIQNGEVVTVTNNNGGINGGITNGMPIVFSCAVKPTPSIYKSQQSVNFKTVENITLEIEGRHDPAIVHRAGVVVDSVTALVLCDLLTGRYGTDYFKGEAK